MGLLGKLNVTLSADAAQFNGAMNKSAALANTRMRSIQRTARQVGPQIGAALAAGAAAFSFQVKRIIDDADNLAKTSRKIGVTVEALSAYRLGAQLAGTNTEALNKGLARLARNASDAANGLATPLRAFEFLDIQVQNSDGSLRDLNDLMLDVADRFEKMENGTKKAALAQELFGRSGVELVPFLNQGRDGLEAIRKEAEQLGIIFSGQTAAAAEEFNDNLTRLKAANTGLFYSITEELGPALIAITDTMVESAKEIRAIDGESRGLGKTLILLAKGALTVSTAFKLAGNSIGDAAALAGALAKGVDPTRIFRGEFLTPYKEALAIIQKGTGDNIQLVDQLVTDMNRLQAAFDNINANPLPAPGSDRGAGNSAGDELTKATEEMKKLEAEGQRLADSLRTPLQVLQDEQMRLNELIAAGAIDMQTYELAAQKLIKNFDEQTKSVGNVNNVMRDLGATFTSEFENAIVQGGNFREMMGGLEQDLIRIASRKALIDPIVNSLFGDSGVLSSLFPSAKGNAFSAPIPFRTGGVLPAPISFPIGGGRTGVAGEAGPEAILPLMRTPGGNLGVSAAGASKTEITIYAPPGSEVSEERQQVGGVEKIQIYIDEAVAKNVRRRGSHTNKALRGEFGVTQALTNR